MPTFAALPFGAQLARIRAIVESGEDVQDILHETAQLVDVEPFAFLLDTLAEAGRPIPELRALVAALGEASLAHLFSRESHPRIRESLEALAEDALTSWPAERIGGLAFLARWLRRRAPARYRALADRAEAEPEAFRALIFASGERLAALAVDPVHAHRVRAQIEAAVDALARAPKSISQANAERLLAQRVYADPGHFFFELLQNADDAGARAFEARVELDQVLVRHDGAPFSLLDLVGVLSIGQTTKRADQIGFFGVGFKSVYEITDRPRVHSGALSFEIAHVSIPRLIAGEPERNGHTTLSLPYATPLDPEALYARARSIPPETLMTLPHLRAMEVHGPDGAFERWTKDTDGAITTLRSAQYPLRIYTIDSTEVSFATPREIGRDVPSPLLIAVASDDEGALIPVTGPTLYSFLPTAERSGLRVIVHARFDVTLDRERLELDSLHNEQLLRAAGGLLARRLASLATSGRSILPALSSPAELSPAMGPLAESLISALRDQPCLIGARGEPLAPSRSFVLSARLTEALGGVDLSDGGRALAPLDDRERDVVLSLGVRRFETIDLVRWLDGVLVPGAPPPVWMIAILFDALLDADPATLRALPILVDGDGRLVSALNAFVDGPAWAVLYAGERAVVSIDSLAALPAALVEKLAIARFDRVLLVDDLHDESRYARLIARADALFLALSELVSLHGLEDVTLFPTVDGRRARIDERLYLLEPGLEGLATSLARSLAILDPDFAIAHPSLSARIATRFGLEALADHLEGGGAVDEERVLHVLEQDPSLLSRRLAHRFAALPLFLDRHGARRPLVGPERALIPAPLLDVRLPDWPWLAEPTRELVVSLAVPEVDATGVARALLGEPDLPAITSAALPGVLRWLTSYARSLSTSILDGLFDAPIWLDLTGTPRTPKNLRRGARSDALDAFYAARGDRFVGGRETWSLLAAFGFDVRLPATDLALAILDLKARGVGDVDREAIVALVEEASRVLDLGSLASLSEVVMFEDEAGRLRPLASFTNPSADACHRPGPFRAVLSAGHFPLLSIADEGRFASWLARAGPEEARALDVVRHAAELITDPSALIGFLEQHADALSPTERTHLAQLPIFLARDGTRRPLDALLDPRVFEERLGASRVAALGLDDLLLDPAHRALCAKLGGSGGSASAILRTRILAQIVEGAPLEAQPAPFRSAEDLFALFTLVHEVGLDPGTAPVFVDDRGTVVKGPLFDADPASRALVRALDFREELIDETWASLAPEGSLEPMPARRIALRLRERCPDERPRHEHPVLPETEVLYAWLRGAREALEVDEPGLRALGGAAVFPSQRGTLRAPRDLVLDPTLPDLGLDWGLASEVPTPIARWLAERFELDRHSRVAVVEHVLDGLDACVDTHDTLRASELLSFLASAVDAPDRDALEARVRRLKIRARLKVPLENGTWDKPRFAWTPSDDVAEHVERFLRALPPRIAFANLGTKERALLAACGARVDLDEATVEACLEGRGLLDGASARRAFARYIASRALSTPSRKSAWRLSQRAWVPSSGAELHRPSELIWPDSLARELFGEDAERFVDPEVAFDLDGDTAGRLGFAKAQDLGLADVTELVEGRPARPALLAWLEAGLRDGRFGAVDVARALAGTLLLVDDDGVSRPAMNLAYHGARELFGARRGNFAEARAYPKLTRALGLPTAPDSPMILRFLREIGAKVDQLSERERDALTTKLPECLRRLAEDPDARLDPGSALAGLDGERAVVTRVSDPALRILAPTELAEMVSASRYIDPLPLAREDALEQLLWFAGIGDLLSVADVVGVVEGPRREDLDARAEALRARLEASLGSSQVGRRVRVLESLEVRWALGAGDVAEGYRGSGRPSVLVAMDAIVHDGTLLITPRGLDAPACLAPALSREPVRRAGLARWLEGQRAEPPKTKATSATSAEAREREGVLSRVRRWFGGIEKTEDERAPTSDAPPTRRTRESAENDEDAQFFRPEREIGSNLDHTDGWLDRRRQIPEVGFAFAPARLPMPWFYAPKTIATGFDRRSQRWEQARLRRPEGTGVAGTVVMQGKLPVGEAILPIPLYAQLTMARLDDAEVEWSSGPNGASALRLAAASRVRLRIQLRHPPDPLRASVATVDALESFVPDDELPDEALDLVASLDPNEPPAARAIAIRDFVRERYRYDPSYLEDPAVGRWLAKLTRGRAHAHVAALHVGRDDEHLGAGVCHELNSLACELMRRAGIPAAIATGWVLDGGAISEPDHLWALALLAEPNGAPLFLPIDASSTRDGRPLRVPSRPAGRFRAPKDVDRREPIRAPKWELGESPRADRGGRRKRGETAGRPDGPSPRPRKKRAPPKAELVKLLHYLSKISGEPIDPATRRALSAALDDKEAAKELLARLLRR